ncbi:hypothetical protein [Flavobacterium sp.]|uniref:hypothetical protein n=1 Tax=Flavobacterium sp. TaxID=239 RepID=UPI00122575E1|nr:hypothetical protein [Flavobacterium sp.]RZJ72218.1 MAG: hypothetical protein EOO49_07125 [Flavobacterium sp.]
MKTRIFYSIFSLFLATAAFAQDRTTVTATNYDVSDNLDLKAVASIFGDSRNLQDFEQRLNDPDNQISNLDLNQDNEVDYIRVIESTQGNTRLVVLQAVLDRDVYQDVATIEVEKSGNNVQLQVVGDVYMYGPNYIYEPVYVTRPVFYDAWWGIGYQPYVSSWYWGYYPSYWHVWNPMPVYRYRNHVHVHVNVHNHYNYVNVRRSRTAATMYNGRRNDGYARRNPNQSFAQRHANVSNRHELEKRRGDARPTRTSDGTRATRANGTRANNGTRAEGTRSNRETIKNATRNNEKATIKNSGTRDYPTRSNPRGGRENGTIKNATRDNGTIKNANTRGEGRANETREIRATRSEATPRTQTSPRNESTPRAVNQPNRATRSEAPQAQPRQSAPQMQQPRQSAPQMQQPRQSAPQMQQPRQSAPQMQQPRQSAPQMQQPRQAAPQMQQQPRQSAPQMQSPGGGGSNRGGNGGGGGRRN